MTVADWAEISPACWSENLPFQRSRDGLACCETSSQTAALAFDSVSTYLESLRDRQIGSLMRRL